MLPVDLKEATVASKPKWFSIQFRSNAPLPARDWRFWAMFASVIPIAFATGLLQWLYLLSFASVPSGAVVYFAAAVHLTFAIWTTRLTYREAKEARERRRLQQSSQRLRYIRICLCAAALVSCAAPATAIAINISIGPMSSGAWDKLALFWRQQTIGF